jgi:hypothetical protein
VARRVALYRTGQPRFSRSAHLRYHRPRGAAFALRRDLGAFGGFHLVCVAAILGCVGDGGMMTKRPRAEITSQAIARNTERTTRTLSTGRSVMRAKGAACRNAAHRQSGIAAALTLIRRCPLPYQIASPTLPFQSFLHRVQYEFSLRAAVLLAYCAGPPQRLAGQGDS